MSAVLAISSISIGLVAGLCFCVGSASLGPRQTLDLASTYWNFNKSLLQALAAQRAQYLTGAVLLVVSFLLQLMALLTASAQPQPSPAQGIALFIAVLVVVGGGAWLSIRVLSSSTTGKAIALHDEDERKSNERRANK